MQTTTYNKIQRAKELIEARKSSLLWLLESDANKPYADQTRATIRGLDYALEMIDAA
jgi:hypothetical protein